MKTNEQLCIKKISTVCLIFFIYYFFKPQIFYLENEREAMLKELEDQKKEIEREQDERRKMQHKIQEMQSKLITGGKDIITHTSEQEQSLRQKRYIYHFNLIHLFI
jgi:septal ring factor EnvC (AmiA/AmiB activator)